MNKNLVCSKKVIYKRYFFNDTIKIELETQYIRKWGYLHRRGIVNSFIAIKYVVRTDTLDLAVILIDLLPQRYHYSH